MFVLGHYELTSRDPRECPKAALVYAGLLFSVWTATGWSVDMFGSKIKALGFTALIEGIMMIADAKWLTAIALVYLVLIAAGANGCRLALPDLAATDERPSNLARYLAAAGAATAAARRRSSSRPGVDWLIVASRNRDWRWRRRPREIHRLSSSRIRRIAWITKCSAADGDRATVGERPRRQPAAGP